MKIKLSLRRQSGSLVDIVVTADSTATIEDVARAIAETDPMSSSYSRATSAVMTLSVAPPTTGELVALHPDALIGEAEIGSGFIASVTAAENRSNAHGDSGIQQVAAILRVFSGPDAGREVPLSAGHSIIGRGVGADVELSDPLVSKRHARLEVGQVIELVDLNSANGVMVDGGMVPRLKVVSGQMITLGDTTVTLTPVASQESTVDPVLERGGALMFNRSPRVEIRYPGTVYPYPKVPTESQPKMFPWPMVVAPIMLGIAMYTITQRPASLLMIFMSPMMMLGNVINQKLQGGQKLKQEIETYEVQIEDLEEELAEQTSVEQERRRAEAPAVAQVYEQAMKLGPLLWTRRPEHWNFLTLRLGVGRALSRNSIAESTDSSGIPKYARQIEKLQQRHKWIDDVPLVETFPSAGAIGIAGSRETAADIMRGLAVQLFGLHAPNELITAAIVDPSWTPELEWMKWLPHTSSAQSPFADIALADSQSAGTALLNALEEAILQRTTQQASHRGPLKSGEGSMSLGSTVGEGAGARSELGGDLVLVLFVSADAPVDRPRLTQVIERGADSGIYTIFLAPTVESLPAACRTFIDATHGLDNATVGFVRSGEDFASVKLEGVSSSYAHVFAKRLAPVVDSSSVETDASDIPRSVNLLNLVGTEAADSPSSVLERWRQNNSVLDRSGAQLGRLKRAGTLKAFVGQGSPDAMTLDLRTQGPHALVGGTTGSGKSEFLQAWVLGMAAEYSPDRVTFLFVDYKGGSAFADCVALPHCVGLVTDLSPHLVRRALTSLRAELHHREHLFNRKKAKDLLELEKRRDPETPPALVLVIDEFAALAGEVPEFVDGVVDIAQRGRSLGIHLIMATQRPAGVIKDNLRANTNLRVALRMADESDSKDVVGDPIAGTFDPSIPGRGIAKTGPGRLVSFQSAYAGGWTGSAVTKAEVRVAELRFGALVLWEADAEPESESHDEDLGPNDQKRMVSNFINATGLARIPSPRRPWLDDLATTVDIVNLPVQSDSQIVLGKADMPERQLQDAVYFSPDRDGSMLVYGTSGSGKSATLRSIAAASGMRPELGDVEVYGLDFGSGSLRSLDALPHVGSIITGDDAERVQRLLRTLGEILDRRGKKFSEANAATLSEYRDITGEREPRVLLLIDGFGQFKADWDATTARLPFYNVFMRILGEGRPLGVHVIATADRSGSVPSAVSANVTKRIVLRLADESAYQTVGVPKDVLDEHSPVGRAIVDGFETQIAILGGTSNVAEQSKALERLAAHLRQRGAREVPEIGALPTALSQLELPSEIADEPVLGIAEDTLAPRGFEPVGTFSISGPPQSGKTNGMKWMITSMLRYDPSVKLFHFAGRRSQLKEFVPWVRSATNVEDARALAKELVDLVPDESIPGRIMIVVEGVTQFADTDAERAMKELFQAINRSDHFLIGDADISSLSSGFGFIGDFKAGRKGIVMKPDSYDGDSVFKTPFPKVKRSDFPPGRGIFVQNGRTVTVQTPLI
ncbi:FtsK/SpoIIIE domain-containing protein [Salinibacterium sp. SWN167]|uniref:FtsK/SpoIIIE domain-containing protein n=1 Tax=Salinibacterium sp. SWN167 TaxID=2792054 RepID=UPI0018CF39AE|nr:FtsK/SpoIIIE domain-containing protein [Salinibacterium sp. SWN167]MBH0082967.1 FHA domain-containing protein [Salinibacterium sp. SWN167]